MQLHELKSKKLKTRKRIGRGGKRGTYSGRGMKGQKSRAGTRKFAPVIRGLIKKYPKLRGYRNQKKELPYFVVNLGDLDKAYNDSEIVNPKTLIEKGLVTKMKGRLPKIKILGNGKLTKKVKIEDCKLSKKAQEKYAK